MRVLLLNSYAGSLNIAAHQMGAEMIGSYEDAAYGIAAQKLNFPEVPYVDRLPWPAQDLTGVHVLAHPPCAPFSVQASNRRTGTGGDDFACHRRVMEYSLGQRCQSLAIESVPGALQARHEYEGAANAHGYRVFFLKVNSVSFGVPQWRPRVWVLFKRVEELPLRWRPEYKTVRDVVLNTGTKLRDGDDEVPRVRRRLREKGLTDEQVAQLLDATHGTGGLLRIGQRYLGLETVGENFYEVREGLGLQGFFASKLPRVLGESSWAPTVLRDSAWFVRGRPLFLEEYEGIMGFPVDYQWPASMGDPRVYLSKGVCPPVAAWVLRQLVYPPDRVAAVIARPREVVDLCPTKAEVTEELKERHAKTTPNRV